VIERIHSGADVSGQRQAIAAGLPTRVASAGCQQKTRTIANSKKLFEFTDEPGEQDYPA